MQHEFKPEIPTLFLGIGNPGTEYKETFHNAGILLLQALVSNQNFSRISKKHFLYTQLYNNIFVQSETYMNESGIAAEEALSYFSRTPESLVLLHDDSDMYLGEYKIQYDAGAAGHKGVSSVITHIGTRKFYRVRIGIRPKQFFLFPRKKAGDFVLSRISKKDKEILTHTFQKIIREILPESLKE